jgi:ABC-type transport system involved in cytochrome c biogenesis ATPase subunit
MAGRNEIYLERIDYCINHKWNVLIVGPFGIGKTHLLRAVRGL